MLDVHVTRCTVVSELRVSPQVERLRSTQTGERRVDRPRFVGDRADDLAVSADRTAGVDATPHGATVVYLDYTRPVPASMLDNPTITSLLGLLVERPLHLYAVSQELPRRLDASGLSVGRGSVRNLLVRLGDIGWVELGGPDSIDDVATYRITEEGLAELRNRVRSQVQDTSPDHDHFVQAVAYIGLFDTQEACLLLRRRRERLTTRLTDVTREHPSTRLGSTVDAPRRGRLRAFTDRSSHSVAGPHDRPPPALSDLVPDLRPPETSSIRPLTCKLSGGGRPSLGVADRAGLYRICTGLLYAATTFPERWSARAPRPAAGDSLSLDVHNDRLVSPVSVGIARVPRGPIAPSLARPTVDNNICQRPGWGHAEVSTIEDPAAAEASLDPLRRQILADLIEPPGRLPPSPPGSASPGRR